MKYPTPAALDRAITDLLLREAGGDGKRYEQLRREVAFERVLARLVAAVPTDWLLKGGVALDYRLPAARSTLDLDISSRISVGAFQDKLIDAVGFDVGDHFEVQLVGEASRPVDEVNTYRFNADVRLNEGHDSTASFLNPVLSRREELWKGYWDPVTRTWTASAC